jgi:hypothetical protein
MCGSSFYEQLFTVNLKSVNTDYYVFEGNFNIFIFPIKDDSVVGEKSSSKVNLKINATYLYNGKKVKCRAENVVSKAEESRTITTFCKFFY